MKPTPEDRAAGIEYKYNITRADGSPVDPQGMYFVLRLDYHEGCDPRHIEACRRAARAYAAHATDNLPVLSRELLEYLDASAPNSRVRGDGLASYSGQRCSALDQNASEKGKS